MLVNVHFQKLSFFTLKTDQSSLRLSNIMLANDADSSAVHSFLTLRTFLVCIFWLI